MSTEQATAQLDDPERIIETVSAEGVTWETSGPAMQVATWLGNATEHDRQVVMRAARSADLDQCVRVSFPSVMTFLLNYQGAGVYRISVPEQD